jgi:hypothetical protein
MPGGAAHLIGTNSQLIGKIKQLDGPGPPFTAVK